LIDISNKLNQPSKNKPKNKRENSLSPKKSISLKREAKIQIERSMSSDSSGNNQNKVVPKEAEQANQLPKQSEIDPNLQKIALISKKLDNVLKEKFTSVDLVAEENSNKIFEDFAFLLTSKMFSSETEKSSENSVEILYKTGV
jgi:hypothetical protein